MFTTALLVLLFAISLAGIIFAARYKQREKKSNYGEPYKTGPSRGVVWGIAAAITGVFMAVFLGTTLRVVNATEIAVPISFGKIGTPITTSGLKFIAPWVKLETYPVRPVVSNLEGDAKVLARTSDAGQVTSELSTRWYVMPERAADLYRQVRTGDDTAISENIVKKNLRQVVGEVYAQTTNKNAIEDRAGSAVAIKEALAASLEPYGIAVEDVNIRSVEPDAKTAETLALLAQETQRTQIAQQATLTAAEDAKRQLVQAQGVKDAAAVLSTIPPEAFNLLCMQTWERVVDGASQPVYGNPCTDSTPQVVAK